MTVMTCLLTNNREELLHRNVICYTAFDIRCNSREPYKNQLIIKSVTPLHQITKTYVKLCFKCYAV